MQENTITEQPLSVSQLNRQVKFMLETHYGSTLVEGEISGLIRPASGHAYFTLKDSQSQIRCAMFKSSLTRTKYVPKDGDQVQLRGRVSLYEARGEYQFVAQTIRPSGEGALQQAFIVLKAKLEQEGLFDADHKRPLPSSINKIGVVTSSSGAAIHDILTVLKRRYPGIEVILYPSLVQGKGAAEAISKAIAVANAREEVDVLIVGRGGGSLEDLWSFNEEQVARAIFASEIPVVSAVGHEIDFSIADFVADIRAATPSAAAELLSPDRLEVMQALDGYEQWFNRSIQDTLDQKFLVLNHIQKRLRHPGAKLEEQELALMNTQARLNRQIESILELQKGKLNSLAARYLNQNPLKQLPIRQQSLSNLATRLGMSLDKQIRQADQALTSKSRELNAISPLATLDRGFSITLDEEKKVLNSIAEVKEGQKIKTKFKDGEVTSVVKSINTVSQ